MDTSSKQRSTCGWIHVAVTTTLSPIQDTCRQRQGIQLVSGLDVSGVNASLGLASVGDSLTPVSRAGL